MSAGAAVRPVARLTGLGLSAGWAPLPPGGPEPGWAARVAAELAQESDACAALTVALERAAPSLFAGGHVLVAVWVPDAAVPVVRGLLVVDVLPGEPGRLQTLMRARAGLEQDAEQAGLQVFGRSVEDADTPAGPALVVREVVAERSLLGMRRRTLEERTTWTVVPHGSSDAVRLLFSTPDLDLGDDLAEQARAIAPTLAVALADPAQVAG